MWIITLVMIEKIDFFFFKLPTQNSAWSGYVLKNDELKNMSRGKSFDIIRLFWKKIDKIKKKDQYLTN